MRADYTQTPVAPEAEVEAGGRGRYTAGMTSVPDHDKPAHAAPLHALFSAAAGALAEVLGGRTPEAALAMLTPALRPGATDMLYATLRACGRGDFMLARLLARALREPGAPLVRALLLLALQRLECEPAHAHTIVDQAVEAAGRCHGGRCKGLVNGVLRNFLRRREELDTAAAADEVAHWQHPRWWVARVRRNHPRHWQQILAAGNLHPPMSLRVNRRRPASADFGQRLRAAGIGAEVQPGGALWLPVPLPVARLPGFAEGECSVQDAGAQRAAPLLAARDGMLVLDACAAPGGKSAHLLELADIDLLALDADAERARRIEANLTRLGLVARVQVADAGNPASWWDGRPFERILADVPCSASGVARRHPDAKWLRRDADIAGFAAAQARIIDALWPLLAPGGKMLYATCSLFAEENTEQVARFLARHRDAALAEEHCLLPTERHDGFYYALLAKS